MATQNSCSSLHVSLSKPTQNKAHGEQLNKRGGKMPCDLMKYDKLSANKLQRRSQRTQFPKLHIQIRRTAFDRTFRLFSRVLLTCTTPITLWNTERNLLYIRNQSVPRCKHFPPQLHKPSSYYYFSGSAAQRGVWPPRSRGFVITHNDAPRSVGLLAQTSTWQHTTQTRNKHPCPWWDSNPWSKQTSSRRPTP
jgi:hypothetical protein